jgi:hypothetical protein
MRAAMRQADKMPEQVAARYGVDVATVNQWMDQGHDEVRGDLPAGVLADLEGRAGIRRRGVPLWNLHIWGLLWLHRRDWGIWWPLKSWLPDRW